MKKISIFCVIFAFAIGAFADHIIYLKNGDKLKGSLNGGKKDSVFFKFMGNNLHLAQDDITAIYLDEYLAPEKICDPAGVKDAKINAKNNNIENCEFYCGDAKDAIKELQQRKQNTINEENSLLQALLRLDENQSYTITELAAQLSAPVVNEPLPSEDYTINIVKVILYFFKSLLLGVVTWLPLVLSLLAAIISIHSDAYPVFNPKAFVVVLFALSPTLLMVLLPKDKVRFPWLPIARKVLIVLCILSIPISFISSICIIITTYAMLNEIFFSSSK